MAGQQDVRSALTTVLLPSCRQAIAREEKKHNHETAPTMPRTPKWAAAAARMSRTITWTKYSARTAAENDRKDDQEQQHQGRQKRCGCAARADLKHGTKILLLTRGPLEFLYT